MTGHEHKRGSFTNPVWTAPSWQPGCGCIGILLWPFFLAALCIGQVVKGWPSMNRRDKIIFWSVLGPFALCLIGGMIIDGGDHPAARPTHSPTPMPTTSCYTFRWVTESPGPVGSRQTGVYEPCNHVQSVEDEERTRIDIDQWNRKIDKREQEEIDRAEYWEQVRRERLERERSGQTTGGPVTVPDPVPLPS